VALARNNNNTTFQLPYTENILAGELPGVRCNRAVLAQTSQLRRRRHGSSDGTCAEQPQVVALRSSIPHRQKSSHIFKAQVRTISSTACGGVIVAALGQVGRFTETASNQITSQGLLGRWQRPPSLLNRHTLQLDRCYLRAPHFCWALLLLDKAAWNVSVLLLDRFQTHK
jgi:hypothetical protein